MNNYDTYDNELKYDTVGRIVWNIYTFNIKCRGLQMVN